MNDLRTAAQQALEALEYRDGDGADQWKADVITALRAALANEALDRMAKHAREVGLDYEPAAAGDNVAPTEPVAHEALRLAGLSLIGLAEHDQHCEVFDLDDEDKHKACTCGLNDAIAVITQAGKSAPPQRKAEWTDADADAARLAMELEALLLSCKDTAAVSRWWDSAHDALELHRQRLARAIEAAHGIIETKIKGDKDA